MKKLLAILVSMILCVSAACAEPMVGGWTNILTEATVLPEDVQAAFNKAVEGQDNTFIPVALLSEQLVAGMNYCILCQVTTADGVISWALVYIYADLQGNAEIMNTWEIYVERHAQPEE